MGNDKTDPGELYAESGQRLQQGCVWFQIVSRRPAMGDQTLGDRVIPTKVKAGLPEERGKCGCGSGG